jgi:hypothetical protein
MGSIQRSIIPAGASMSTSQGENRFVDLAIHACYYEIAARRGIGKELDL